MWPRPSQVCNIRMSDAYRLLDAFELLFGRSQGYELVGAFDFDGRWVRRRPVLNPLQQENSGVEWQFFLRKQKTVQCHNFCVQCHNEELKRYCDQDLLKRVRATLLAAPPNYFTHFYFTPFSCCMGLWVGKAKESFTRRQTRHKTPQKSSLPPCYAKQKAGKSRQKYLLNFNFFIVFLHSSVVAGIVAAFEFFDLREKHIMRFLQTHFRSDWNRIVIFCTN